MSIHLQPLTLFVTNDKGNPINYHLQHCRRRRRQHDRSHRCHHSPDAGASIECHVEHRQLFHEVKQTQQCDAQR